MTEDDPLRLKSGSEAPPELSRALRALGKRDRDAARLARVADKLGALLDAPPPVPTSGLRKLLGTKAGITGIVAGIAGLGLLAYQLATGQPEASVTQPPAAPPEPAALVPSQEPPPPPAASSTPEPAAPSGTNSRRSRRHAAPTRPTAHSPAASVGPASAPASAPQPSSDSAPAPRPSPTPVAEKAPVPAAPAAQQAEQRSEVQLLFEARNVLPQQPAAALRLLDEHAARFGKGQLAPEREVLAIEALRKLGRTAEATQRLQRFQSQYPRSIHLRRLQDKN